MKLNDRNLSYEVPSQVGNDVALLQFELLRFSVYGSTVVTNTEQIHVS